MRSARSLQWALGAATALLAAAPTIAIGQCAPGGPPNPPWIKGSLVGIVMDTSHRVLADVDVAIRSPQRKTRTDRNGRFQIAELDTGVYELVVRRLGYEIAEQSYQVTDSGGGARFCLVPEPRGLPAMITSATRAGLGGVVGDSTYKPIRGAEVRVIAGGHHAITDSAGGFHLPLKKGTHGIVVSKAGFGRQLVSVTIPEDSGRQIAVWLGSPKRNELRMAVALDDMRNRILWARPNRFGMMSSEDLAKISADLSGAAMQAGRTRLPPVCAATIDGGPFTLPLHLIDKDEVALLEVHVPPPPRRTTTSINAQGTRGGGTPPPVGCPANIFVWLKP